MMLIVQIWLISLVCIANICCECDVCQSTNFVACHEENIYSLCVNGSATKNFITCPKNHVCTPDPYVCYPKSEAKSSCERKRNLCGVCSENKVYACTNETTIAFCYGKDKPVKGAEFSYCLGDTVCDIFSKNGFCTESYLAEPSCVTAENEDVDSITKISTETSTLDTTTLTKQTTILTAATEPAATTMITKITTKPTQATTFKTTSAETITTTPITEPNIPTTTAVFTTTTATTEMATTARTTEAITIKTPEITTTAETITKPTIEPSSKATTMEPTTPQATTEQTTVTTTSRLTTTTIKATTPAGPATPDEICKQTAVAGSFGSDDPTCTTFVICYKMNGEFTGLEKKCPNTQYFSSDTRRCSFEKPDGCV